MVMQGEPVLPYHLAYHFLQQLTIIGVGVYTYGHGAVFAEEEHAVLYPGEWPVAGGGHYFAGFAGPGTEGSCGFFLGFAGEEVGLVQAVEMIIKGAYNQWHWRRLRIGHEISQHAEKLVPIPAGQYFRKFKDIVLAADADVFLYELGGERFFFGNIDADLLYLVGDLLQVGPQVGGQYLRFALGYVAGDMTVALFLRRYPSETWEPGKLSYLKGLLYPNWAAWQVGSIAGIFLGSTVPAEWGLGFAGTLAIICIMVPLIAGRAAAAGVAVAGVTAVLLNGMPYKLGLLAAVVLGMASAMVVAEMFGKARK